MKLKDLHINLKKEINLLEFCPKKEILVDSFGIEKKIINDLYTNKFKKNIKLKQRDKILIKKISRKNNFDGINNNKIENINLSEKKDKRIFFRKNKKFVQDFLVIIKNYQIKNIFFSLVNRKGINKIFGSRLYKILFIIFVFLFIIFIDKQFIEYYTNNGYKKIEQLKNNGNLEEKFRLTKSAKSDFLKANFLFIPFSIFPGEKINNAKYVISGGLKISNLLFNIFDFILKSDEYINKKGEENIMYSQLLENSKKIFIYTHKQLEEIIKNYSKINFSKNKIRQNKIDYLIYQAKKYNYYIGEINNNFDTFLEILGHNKRKKYLIVFQNNDEIRAQGGFMGSMGIIEIFRGQVKKLQKKDVYDYEFKIKKEIFTREEAPEGLNKLTFKLGLRDANYFINLKDSSNKIKFFIQKAGYDIDGIIYINQNVLFDILDLIGEYHSDVLNTNVNSKKFSILMSSLVEAKKSKVGTLGTPKKVLFDFIEEFKQKLKFKKISKFKLFEIIFKNIEKREIKFYIFDNIQRAFLDKIGLFKKINYNQTLDFNYPIFTSISGNKSDRYISIAYKKNVEKLKNCNFKTNFEVILNHNFDKKEEEKILRIFKKFNINDPSSKLLNIQGKGKNRQYVRIILSKDSIIEKNKDIISIKKYNKNQKVVAFYLNTKAGETSKFNLKYILKNKNCKIYNYKLYKQAGIKKYDFIFSKDNKKRIFKNIKEDLFIN